MQTRHTPVIGPTHWFAVLGASVAGANLAAFSGQGGLAGQGGAAGLWGAGAWGYGPWAMPVVLAVLGLLILLVEPRDRRAHGVWFWALILVVMMGTSALVQALVLLGIPREALAGLFALGLVAAAWCTRWAQAPAPGEDSWQPRLGTGAAFWLAMLAAGGLGAALGERLTHGLGEAASAGLWLVLWVAALVAWHRGQQRAYYWLAVAAARTAGVCLGAWLMQSEMLGLGVGIASVLTGGIYLALVIVIELTGADFVTATADIAD